MKLRLKQILENALSDIKSASSKEALESARVRYLGKKGELTAILRGMGALSAEERPVMGQIANEVRAEIEKALADAAAAFSFCFLLLYCYILFPYYCNASSCSWYIPSHILSSE